MMDPRPRSHATDLAFLVHRVSGLVLALFLPIHVWALPHAIRGEATLEGGLRRTDNASPKPAETGLVMPPAAHLAGGLRVLALECLGWRPSQKTMAAASAGVALGAGLPFLPNR